MGDGKFRIKGKKRKPVDKSMPVRIPAEAYNMLVEMYNNSGIPIGQIAAQAVLFAAENTVYDMED